MITGSAIWALLLTGVYGPSMTCYVKKYKPSQLHPFIFDEYCMHDNIGFWHLLTEDMQRMRFTLLLSALKAQTSALPQLREASQRETLFFLQ